MSIKTLFFSESPYLFIFITIAFGIVDYVILNYCKCKSVRTRLILSYFTLIFLLVCFYRIPERINHSPSEFVVAPCDGKVMSVLHLDDGLTHIAIYLNIFDTHVQWSPIHGRVTSLAYKKGTFNFAHLLNKSKHNERLEMMIYSPLIQKHIKVVQIAGQFVRRIVNFTQQGDDVQRGDLIGMIKLSSRVDLFIPTKHIELHVRKGERIFGNQTIIGKLY